MRIARSIVRILLGLFITYAGVAHLTYRRADFQYMVPRWLTTDTYWKDVVVLASGVVEIVLGVAILFISRRRPTIGWITALFLVAVFFGNLEQYQTGANAFHMDTDAARLIRLFFQPLLIWMALWSMYSIYPERKR